MKSIRLYDNVCKRWTSMRSYDDPWRSINNKLNKHLIYERWMTINKHNEFQLNYIIMHECVENQWQSVITTEFIWKMCKQICETVLKFKTATKNYKINVNPRTLIEFNDNTYRMWKSWKSIHVYDNQCNY